MKSEEVRLKYEFGLNRIFCPSEGTFRWEVNALSNQFDIDQSAFVRKLEFRLGEDPRICSGLLSLVPAAEGSVSSNDDYSQGHSGRTEMAVETKGCLVSP